MNRRNFLKGFAAATIFTALAPLPSIVELSTNNASYLTVDQIIQTTLMNYRNILAKNITDQQCIWMKLKEKGLIEING